MGRFDSQHVLNRAPFHCSPVSVPAVENLRVLSWISRVDSGAELTGTTNSPFIEKNARPGVDTNRGTLREVGGEAP